MINFIKNLLGLSLRAKVLKAIDAKIKQSEAQLQNEVNALKTTYTNNVIDQIQTMFTNWKNLKTAYKNSKKEVEANAINNLLGKIL